MMYHTLKKFLILHHHLALPGIGNFSVEKLSARIDITNRTITPPVTKINFSNEKLPADKLFIHFLAQELKVDEPQAISHFTDFTTRLQSNIKEDKQVVIKGFGKLKKRSFDTLDFEPEEMPAYFPVLTAERVIRKNATHTVMVGEDEKTSDEMQVVLQEEATVVQDRWWIPAIILGVIGISALIYYYNILHPAQF